MPNQLTIPFKESYKAPVKQAAWDYIHARTETHPDAFKWDINQWEKLREEGRGGKAHVDRINATINYHAQLVFILTKLPSDINLEIAYAPVFSPKSLPIILRSLFFERAAVLFNLGALYSQLASSEDRSNEDGLKRAINYYQTAAGTFNFLLTSALPKLEFAPGEENIPLDLTNDCVKSLEFLMLAQAQECVWQKAVMGHLKNGLIAKLAAKVASLYRASATSIRQASPPVKHIFPSDWLPHLDTKQCHFAAAAQYRKSIDELEANRYGVEIGRLHQAHVEAKKGYDIARKGGVAPAVLQDIKSVLDNAQKNITRAERDNDLIYHQDVPAGSALDAIPETAVAQIAIPPGLKNPQSVIGDDSVIFGEMPGWGAGEAINIYNDNKQILIQERVTTAAQELEDDVNNVLRSLNLPSSLDALERPIGLPPSLLKKAEEVRLEEGPARIEESIDNIERFAEHNAKLLDEAMDILDSEASEDEAARSTKPLKRPPSHVANQQLIHKGERYRKITTEANDSDEHVRRKWDEWETHIRELTWDEADLEVLVPSSTVSTPGRSATGTNLTQTHARALRVLLESLDDLQRTREKLVQRAVRLGDADDIGPRIMKVASGFERWVDVKPDMFDDVSNEELAKYDKFVQGIEEARGKQMEVLEKIKARNELFLHSRKDDSSIKDREHALQSLDLAYHMYREITRNLDEGLKFYNDLASILSQFKESCKVWSNSRRQELHSMWQSMQPMPLQDKTDGPTDAPTSRITTATTSTPTPATPEQRSAQTLPSLNSADWESEDLPPPPRVTKKKK